MIICASKTGGYFYRIFSCILSLLILLQGLPVCVFSAPGPEVLGITSVTDLADIKIPEILGNVKEIFSGTTGKAVILIQDYHCNYLAQQNISKILDTLHKGQLQHLLKSISVEGAQGKVDVSPLTSMQSGGAKKKIIDFFVRQGFLSGSEKFISENGDEIELFGAEEGALYQENLQYFRETLAYNKKIKIALDLLETRLLDVGKVVNSRQLQLLSEKLRKAHANVNLLYEVYKRQAENLEINLKEFPSIQKMIVSQEIEKDLIIDDMYQERTELIRSLQKKLVKEDATLLVLNSLKYRTGRQTSREFYAYLEKVMKDNCDDTSAYPNLLSYFKLVKIQNDIDDQELSDEIDVFETTIKEKIFDSPYQKQLDRLLKNISLYKDLFKLNMRRKDFTYLQTHRDQFYTDYFKKFLKKIEYKIGVHYSWDDRIDVLDEYIETGEAFYNALIERDKVLIRNTLSYMNKKDLELSVMVFGGFHTDGIVSELKQRNVSYFVVLPWGDVSQEDALYHQMLLREKNPVEVVTGRTGEHLAPRLWLKNEMSLPDEVTTMNEALFLLYSTLGLGMRMFAEEMSQVMDQLNTWARENGITGKVIRTSDGKLEVTAGTQTFSMASLVMRYEQLSPPSVEEIARLQETIRNLEKLKENGGERQRTKVISAVSELDYNELFHPSLLLFFRDVKGPFWQPLKKAWEERVAAVLKMRVLQKNETFLDLSSLSPVAQALKETVQLDVDVAVSFKDVILYGEQLYASFKLNGKQFWIVITTPESGSVNKQLVSEPVPADSLLGRSGRGSVTTFKRKFSSLVDQLHRSILNPQQSLTTLCAVAQLQNEDLREFVRELFRNLPKDQPQREFISTMSAPEDIVTLFELLNPANPESVARYVLEQLLFDSISNKKVLLVLAKSLYDLETYPEASRALIEPVLTAFMKLISDENERGKLQEILDTLQENERRLVSGQIGKTIFAMQENEPAIVFIDISTFDQESWKTFAGDLREAKQAIVVLVNHDPEKERELQSWKASFKEYLPDNRLFAVNILAPSDASAVQKQEIGSEKIREMITQIQDENAEVLFSEENYIFFIDEAHESFYKAFADAIRTVLGTRGAHVLSESEQQLMKSIGVDIDVVELLEEIVVSTERTQRLLEVTEQTLKKG